MKVKIESEENFVTNARQEIRGQKIPTHSWRSIFPVIIALFVRDGNSHVFLLSFRASEQTKHAVRSLLGYSEWKSGGERTRHHPTLFDVSLSPSFLPLPSSYTASFTFSLYEFQQSRPLISNNVPPSVRDSQHVRHLARSIVTHLSIKTFLISSPSILSPIDINSLEHSRFSFRGENDLFLGQNLVGFCRRNERNECPPFSFPLYLVPLVGHIFPPPTCRRHGAPRVSHDCQLQRVETRSGCRLARFFGASHLVAITRSPDRPSRSRRRRSRSLALARARSRPERRRLRACVEWRQRRRARPPEPRRRRRSDGSAARRRLPLVSGKMGAPRRAVA